MEDIGTALYFDNHTPEYSTDCLDYAIATINRYGKADCTLVDIGCGTGNSLALLRSRMPLNHLMGIDVSSNSLVKAKERSGCDALVGSILDPNFVHGIVQRPEAQLVLAAEAADVLEKQAVGELDAFFF